MNSLPDKPWFFVSEAAQLLGVSRMTMYRWIQKGTVESIGMLYYQKVSRASLQRLKGEADERTTADECS